MFTNILNLQIFPMYGINSLGSRHTHTQTHTDFPDKSSIVTGPVKTGHICKNYTCLVNGTFLGHCVS